MRKYYSSTDIELVDLLKSKDEAAFSEIYERYWTLLYSHAFKMLRDDIEAKDIVQDLFITLWTNTPQTTNLAGYLYTAVRNKVINMIQQQKVKEDYLSSLALFMDRQGSAADDAVNMTDLALAVETEINALPAKMREIFDLSRNHHLSHKEIAGQLKISDKTVKKQISNALKIIKIKLNLPNVITICTSFFLKEL